VELPAAQMAKMLTEDKVRSASPATSPSCRHYSAEANCVGFGPALSTYPERFVRHVSMFLSE
jgi:hypothetical protein